MISVINKIEVLGFEDFPAKMRTLENSLDTATVLPLDNNTAGLTIMLRRRFKKLKPGDAVIAAAALQHNLTLITRNTDDFKYIDDKKLLDLHKL